MYSCWRASICFECLFMRWRERGRLRALLMCVCGCVLFCEIRKKGDETGGGCRFLSCVV
jgi:hypothetical protein